MGLYASRSALNNIDGDGAFWASFWKNSDEAAARELLNINKFMTETSASYLFARMPKMYLLFNLNDCIKRQRQTYDPDVSHYIRIGWAINWSEQMKMRWREFLK